MAKDKKPTLSERRKWKCEKCGYSFDKVTFVDDSLIRVYGTRSERLDIIFDVITVRCPQCFEINTRESTLFDNIATAVQELDIEYKTEDRNEFKAEVRQISGGLDPKNYNQFLLEADDKNEFVSTLTAKEREVYIILCAQGALSQAGEVVGLIKKKLDLKDGEATNLVDRVGNWAERFRTLRQITKMSPKKIATMYRDDKMFVKIARAWRDALPPEQQARYPVINTSFGLRERRRGIDFLKD
jgi:hypothetical protein